MIRVRGIRGRVLLAIGFGTLLWGGFGAVQAGQTVVFTSGATLAIAGYHLDEGLLVLSLEGGGELGCRPSQIARFEVQDPEFPPTSPSLAPEPPRPSSPPQPVLSEPLAIFSPSNPEPGVRAMIQKMSREWRVDPKLVEAVVRVESNFDPYAVSHKGAMGLMQLMPQTAQHYQVENVFDPAENLEGGIRHLKGLLDRYGETSLALAAYNAGEGAVARAGGIPPYRETRAYVGRIMTLIQP